VSDLTDGRKTAIDVSISSEAWKLVRGGASTEACVVVLAGAKIGQHVVLSERVTEIGRSPRCGLQLDVSSVSRVHAHLEWDGQQHLIVDDGSTNGTYVDQARITRHALRDGDRFECGNVLLKYIASGNIEGAYHQELQRLATHDGLTGVVNKAYFNDQLQDAVALTRATPTPITLLVLDLDHFKRVNDDYGHPAGDAALRKTAEIVQGNVSDGQLFGRVGGEEFAVMCPGQELEDGKQLAELIRSTVEGTRYVFDGREIPVTTSVGVAARPAQSDESAEALFSRADARLYEAKSSGRNCVRA
jgi:two-component system cell cycle response regulator